MRQLDPKIYIEIKRLRLYGIPVKSIARRCGVSTGTVTIVLAGRRDHLLAQRHRGAVQLGKAGAARRRGAMKVTR